MTTISCQFDSGAIEVLSSADPVDIRLRIRQDNAAEFAQWFHFRLQGAAGVAVTLRFVNAGQCAYPKGWEGYRVAASHDRRQWERIDTDYDGAVMTARLTPRSNSVQLAYFEPYSWERHLDLLARVSASEHVVLERLGASLDGRDIDLLRITDAASPVPEAARRQVWLIARQPGLLAQPALERGIVAYRAQVVLHLLDLILHRRLLRGDVPAQHELGNRTVGPQCKFDPQLLLGSDQFVLQPVSTLLQQYREGREFSLGQPGHRRPVHQFGAQLQLQQCQQVAPAIRGIGFAHQRSLARALNRIGLAVRMQRTGKLAKNGAQRGIGVLGLRLGLARTRASCAPGLGRLTRILRGLRGSLHLFHAGAQHGFGVAEIDRIVEILPQHILQKFLGRLRLRTLALVERTFAVGIVQPTHGFVAVLRERRSQAAQDVTRLALLRARQAGPVQPRVEQMHHLPHQVVALALQRVHLPRMRAAIHVGHHLQRRHPARQCLVAREQPIETSLRSG